MLLCISTHAQEITWEAFIEELTDEGSTLEEEQETSWAAFMEEAELLHEHPINLNQATASELERLFFLDTKQVQAILDYRERYGFMRTLGELLLIRELDWRTRQLLHLFTFVAEPPPDRKRSGRQTLTHEGVARIDVPIYRREGWNWAKGLAHQWRWDTSLGQTMQAGIRGESDAGEPYSSHGIHGWDAIGGYAQLNNIRCIQTAIIGDFKLNFAEGLVASNTIRFGKNGAHRWLANNTVRPHRSTDEYNFMRGAAITIALPRRWTITGFYSMRKLDATIQDDNTIRSLTTSGLHRTAHELEQRHALTGHTTGGHAGWDSGTWKVGATGLYQYYDHQLSRGPSLYQQIAPTGYQFGDASIDYGYNRYPLTIHGETARSFSRNGGAWASVNQISFRMGSSTLLSLAQRFYGKRYFSPYANSFAENTRAQNESGVCILFDAERLGPISLNSYVDVFYSPWPRYTMSRESRGGEGMLQLGWNHHRNQVLQLRYQVKSKERSDRRYWTHRLRATAQHRPNNRWLLRMSAWWTLYYDPDKPDARHARSTGLAIGPHAQFTSTDSHWRWTAQSSWFRTDSYDSRIYGSEPHLTGVFSLPNLSGHGVRLVTTTRWQPSRRIQLQGQLGCTRYFDRSAISSGPLLIHSPWKTDFSIMARLRL